MPSDGRRDNRSSGRGPRSGSSSGGRSGGGRSSGGSGRPPGKGGKPAAKRGRPPGKGGKPAAKRGRPPGKGDRPAGKGRPAGRDNRDGRDDRDLDDRGDRRDRPAGRERRDGERETRTGPDLAGPAKWGRIARGGAGRMESPAIGTEAMDDIRPPRKRPPKPPVDHVADGESLDGEGPDATLPPEPVVEKKPLPKRERDLPGAEDLQRHAAKAVRRSRGPAVRERKPLGARPQRVQDPAVVLERLVGPDRGKKLARRLKDAGRAFETERFDDARVALRPILTEAPELAEARELLGLSLYRLGRWKAAIDELETFRELTHSTEQHPVLMDCHRAKGRWADVEALWEELGEASPAGSLVTEGRIVLAGAQADQDDIEKAIRTLQAGWKLPKRPQDHHLRRAYALADLYDRAGKTARARELFKWIAGHDPRFADVKTRVKALS